MPLSVQSPERSSLTKLKEILFYRYCRVDVDVCYLRIYHTACRHVQWKAPPRWIVSRYAGVRDKDEWFGEDGAAVWAGYHLDPGLVNHPVHGQALDAVVGP